MIPADRLLILHSDHLAFPVDVDIPTKYFRLLVAADYKGIPTKELLAFARDLLKRGVAYFSVWGEGCERMHDCMDEEISAAELERNSVVEPLTTWHANEPLEETAQFFRDWAKPEEKYESESRFWVCLAVGKAKWADVMKETVLRN
jgi:hypothetical protein